MSQAARVPRKAPPDTAPDIALVPDAAKPAPAGKPAAQQPVADGAATPVVTLDDPWRYLHPSRVWPD